MKTAKMILFVEFELTLDSVMALERLRRLKTVRHGRLADPFTCRELLKQYGQRWREEIEYEKSLPLSAAEIEQMIKLPPCKICAE